MGTDDRINCPTCHLDVAPGPRCEICGSPLPAMPPPAFEPEGRRAPEPDTPFEPAEIFEEKAEPEPFPVEPPLDPVEVPEPEPELGAEFTEAETPPGHDPATPPPEDISADPETVQPIAPEPSEIAVGPGSETPPDARDPQLSEGPWARPDPIGFTVDPDPVPPPPPPPAPPPPAPPPPPPPAPPQPPAPPSGFKAMMWRLVFDFQFDGRMAREEYWKMFASRLVVVLVLLAIAAGSGGEADMADMADMGGEPDMLGLLAGLLMIVVGASGIAEAARRLHDTGKSGWWNLLWLIPYLGWAGLLFLLAQPGTAGDNAYGAPPPPSSPPGAPGR